MTHITSLLTVIALAIAPALARAENPPRIDKSRAAAAGVPGAIADRPAPGLVRPVLRCPDPAITQITVTNVRAHAGGVFDFTLGATLRNAGTAPYRTSPGQQAVNAYIHPPGTQPRHLRTYNFQDLAIGEQRQLQYEVRGWRSSDEFPPSYEFALSYDPDILSDGNKANDDCRTVNNRRTISPREINTAVLAGRR